MWSHVFSTLFKVTFPFSRSRSGAVDTRLLPCSGMDPPVVWMKFSNRRSLQPRSYKTNGTSRNRVKAGRLVKANWSFSKKSGTSTERMRKKRSLASCNHDFLRVQACQFFVGCVKSFFVKDQANLRLWADQHYCQQKTISINLFHFTPHFPPFQSSLCL